MKGNGSGKLEGWSPPLEIFLGGVRRPQHRAEEQHDGMTEAHPNRLETGVFEENRALRTNMVLAGRGLNRHNVVGLGNAVVERRAHRHARHGLCHGSGMAVPSAGGAMTNDTRTGEVAPCFAGRRKRVQ